MLRFTGLGLRAATPGTFTGPTTQSYTLPTQFDLPHRNVNILLGIPCIDTIYSLFSAEPRKFKNSHLGNHSIVCTEWRTGVWSILGRDSSFAGLHATLAT